MSPSWRWAGASCIGLSHQKAGEKRQDAFKCFTLTESDIFFGVVCDGAGSTKWGGVGAWITSRIIAKRCLDYLKSNTSFPTEKIVWEWIDEVRDILFLYAKLRNTVMNEFATTLAFVLASKSQIVTGNIGDGASVGYDNLTQSWITLSWPEHGEYASTTRFITENSQPNFRYQVLDVKLESIIIFTDGIERLALDFVNRVPFSNFLTPMAAALANINDAGEIKHISLALKEYLSSDKINARTDDDKTLIIASISHHD